MSQIFNVYCDESCQLENDHKSIMVLGAVWCPLDKTRQIAVRVREIKQKHGLSSHLEIKWTKVSPSKLAFFLDILDYFFDNDELHFRALVVSKDLPYQVDGQTYEDWYYHNYFDMLTAILNPKSRYRIYLDIKDTIGVAKIAKLQTVFISSFYDFSQRIIERLQPVRSYEVEILQLADLLIGAVSAVNRGFVESQAKQTFITRMRQRSGYSLTKSTLYLESKVNLFCWKAHEARYETRLVAPASVV
jgi:hypothetical protein